MSKDNKKPTVVPPAAVEVMPPPQKIDLCQETLPATFEAMQAPLPTDRKECISLAVTTAYVASMRFALQMWSIGRILKTLNDRGEENVLSDVMAATGYQIRNLQYCLSMYDNFPDPRRVYELSGHIEWTGFKELLKLKSPDVRDKVCKKIESGKLKPADLGAAVKEIQEAAKPKEKGNTDPAPMPAADTAPAPADRPDPKKVFGLLETTAAESLKQLLTVSADAQAVMESMWNPELFTETQFSDAAAFFDKAQTAVKDLVAKLKKRIDDLDKFLEKGPKKKA